jgi:hypothetical protein
MSNIALLHLHQVSQPAVAKALDQALGEWKYQRKALVNLSEAGPGKVDRPLDPGLGHLAYLLSPRQGNWTTLVQPFEDRDDAPFLADLSNRLSNLLQTHSLAILLHEGDVLFYNLDYRGTPRDGYTSNPQYFADQRLADPDVIRQRHMPKAFTPLLPKTIKMDKFQQLLDAGWWHAFDTRQLDDTGDLLHEDALVDEEERLTALGGMLQLNGPAGYPYVRWRTSTAIHWKGWQALYYQARGRSLQMI